MEVDPKKPRTRPRRDRSNNTNYVPLHHPNCDYESLTIEDLDCPICIQMVNEPVRLKCNHLLCKECFEKLLELSARRCPICRRWIACRRICDWLDRKLWDFIRKKFLQPVDVEGQIKADRKLARKLCRERYFRRSHYVLRSSSSSSAKN